MARPAKPKDFNARRAELEAKLAKLAEDQRKQAADFVTTAGLIDWEPAALMGALLDAAPALKPQVAEADWIGNRRWNLTFKTGQVLALPEGDKGSAGALVAFARLDGANRLLGGRVAAFDMRAPDRIYLRVPGRTDAPAALPVAAVSAASSEAQ